MPKSLSPDNAAIADALERYASLLDLSGSGYYTVRAYRRAAELIRPLTTPLAKLVRENRVQELRGIGPGIASVLRELAGDPGRWADVANPRGVGVASARPNAGVERFASLPTIVSVIERESRHAVGLTVEGIPVELVVAEPGRFGTELLRATGTPEFV